MSKGKISPAYVVALANILLTRFENQRQSKIDKIYKEAYDEYLDYVNSFFLGIISNISWKHWIKVYFFKKPTLTYEEFKINPIWPHYGNNYHLRWLEDNDCDCGHRVKDVISLKALKSLYEIGDRSEKIWLDSKDALLLEEAVEEYNAKQKIPEPN